METEAIKIAWCEKKGHKCLVFSFDGFFTEEQAAQAKKRWVEEFATQLQPNEKVPIIFSCLKMTGYDTNARLIWQNSIGELKAQISTIWVVSNNSLFTIAAKTMGFISKFTIKTAKSEDEIYL
ncbi:MAG TPA: hypothetical protein VMW01_10515 [Williamwhitmania sp.]|nr:hypothetical protein [Williamwhitmania sp.]